jgi:hypothetical protein
LRANTEPPHLGVPGKYISVEFRQELVHRAFHDFRHNQFLLYRPVIVPKSASPDFPVEAGEAGGKHESENRRVCRGYRRERREQLKS